MHRPETTQVRLELIFPLLLLKPSGKLRKPLTSIWRIRILYTPGSEPEEKELFEAKQSFMFSVFNANLQTDMGKTIVRRHLANTDAQAVWKELSKHMRTSSKGASEKRRLTQYVTNTVLDDNFKGTTEQFVLHFNEQFRQLEEISEDSERLPPTVKLTLL